MYATERQHQIVDEVTSTGRVSVAKLSRRFDVTTETIRRDLDLLESLGHLRRVHGGAVRRATAVEFDLDHRRGTNTQAKLAIARVALALVPQEVPASIALDAGTTVGALGEQLVEWRPARGSGPLDVITNAVPLIGLLQRNAALAVHAIGGHVRPTTSAAVGPAAVEGFARMRADIAFIGTNGLSADFGLSTPDEREAAVKVAIVRAARRVVVLADGSKLGEEALCRFAQLTDIDTLVTDQPPEDELAAALDSAAVEVVIARTAVRSIGM